MSIKSLLQIIIFLIIILLILGIYILYFDSESLKNQLIIGKNLDKITKKSSNEELLEDVVTSKNEKDLNKTIDIDNKVQLANKENQEIDLTKNLKKKELNLKENSKEDIKNLTKEIEYTTSNEEGDKFKITAKYGKTNNENSNILDLEDVDGIISSTKRSEVFITSDYAKYNYNNQNSRFYNNVKIKYDDKIITCDTLDLQTNNNLAIAYNNVKIEDGKSIMKAQNVILNLINKNIKINSKDKIKIFTN
tara:strand:+ start:1591 stop:2337 length:747 start_codon:yes stop_codon:yes gene_type:complete